MAGIRVYKHYDYGGPSAYWSHAPGYRYYRIWKDNLGSYGLHDEISSLRVYLSWGGEGETFVLFEDPHFNGRFVAFAGQYPNRGISSLAGYNFNDKTSSILLIHHSPKEFLPLRLGELARKDATSMVDDALSGVAEASRRGDLIFTWEMWPDFDPTKKFVRLDIPIRVHVPNWWDYNATITYYVYLYIDSNYRLRGYVNWVETWVEGGVMSGSINDRLFPEAYNAAGKIDIHLNDTLAELDFYEWQYYYLMPGKAPIPIPSDYSGHIADDVTVILVRR